MFLLSDDNVLLHSLTSLLVIPCRDIVKYDTLEVTFCLIVYLIVG